MRRSLPLALTALMAMLAAPPAAADTLLLDAIDQTRAAGPSTPQRGMSMNEVETMYGTPRQRRAAVGSPPITRWEYADFIVYFEHRFVIHAVRKRG